MKKNIGASSVTKKTPCTWLGLLSLLKGSFLHPQWLSDRYHAISKNLLKNINSGNVLDIGSGNSDHSSIIGSNANLIRLDYPDTNAWYLLKPDVYGNALELPLFNGCIQHILLLEVLEHIFDYQKVLEECRRVLVADGFLFLSVPFVYPVHDAPHDFHRFTIHGLVAELTRTGFEIEHIQQHGNSIVVALQMMNLSLLELVKKGLKKHFFFGMLLVPPVYLACLSNNLMAIPFLGIRFNDASVFGYFVIARSVC